MVVLVDFLQYLETGTEAQTKGLEERIGVFAVHAFRAPRADCVQIDGFGLAIPPVRVEKFSLRVKGLLPLRLAEDFELHGLAAGLQLDEDLLGNRAPDCNRTHPENVLNSPHRPAGRDFSRFSGQLE